MTDTTIADTTQEVTDATQEAVKQRVVERYDGQIFRDGQMSFQADSF